GKDMSCCPSPGWSALGEAQTYTQPTEIALWLNASQWELLEITDNSDRHVLRDSTHVLLDYKKDNARLHAELVGSDTMKLQLLTCALLAVASCSFVEFLESLQHHHSFQRLSVEEKLLFSELVLAAEEGALEAFIDKKGLVNVISLMDHMSQYDAQKFEAYLAEHLNYTHHLPDNGDVINKREEHHHQHVNAGQAAESRDNNWLQFSHYLQNLHSQYYDSLPEQERQTYYALADAAEHGNMTEYIDQVGYGAIFGLLEYLDYQHANQLYELLEYYQHLPELEKNTFNELMAAAANNDVTGYINKVGYGPIFGLMEHLDYTHANRVYDLLEQ
ncbi:hypothetical protein BaRGS_00009230, partial [Batillaria attramentaria]